MTVATEAAVDLVVQAERHMLGTLMVSLDDTPAADILEPGDFYLPTHGAIYAAILAVRNDGRAPDLISVGEALLASGDLARVGRLEHLHDLVSAAMLPGSTESYVRIIKDARARRDRVAALAALNQWAGDDDAWNTRSPDLLARLIGAPVRAGEPDSWTPLDLGPYLRGEVARPEPTVGAARADGLRFIYPGKEHSVIGEMEAGKSWFCLASVAAELAKGNAVVYVHFEESDPSDTIERLQVLDVPDRSIAAGFRFVAPSAPVNPARIAALLDPPPSLVVLDGVNEGMSLHGAAVREEDGVAMFRRLMIKPFIAAGAAVLSADHVVKDRETRGRYALGSIHKGNALSGALILLENAEPFGRGQRGASHIYVTKDRPGHLRRHGRGTKTSGKTFMGTMAVDDTRRWSPRLELEIMTPPEPTAQDGEVSKDDQVLAAVRTLATAGQTATLRAVRATVTGVQASAVDNALERLRLAGRVMERPGPNRSRIFIPSVSQEDLDGIEE